MRNRLVPKRMTLTSVYRSHIMSTIASYSPLNISEIVRVEASFQRTTNRKWLVGYQMAMRLRTSCDPKRPNWWLQYA